MAFSRKKNPRQLELTSLIDIVFLLLIFFLVSFAVSLVGEASQSNAHSEMDLPQTDAKLPTVEHDFLENLMIQIVPDTTSQGVVRKVFVLWPAFQDTTKVSRMQALMAAQRDSLFEVFPANFLTLPAEEFEGTDAGILIKSSIESYVQRAGLYNRNAYPIIEVRAEQHTEFRILNLIMEQCSFYKDAIPQIIIRTGL